MILNQADSPQAKPLDTLLASYAAGGLNAPLHALVGSHLALSGQNRGFVAALEELASRGIAEAPPRPLVTRDAMLARIFSAEAPVSAQPALVADPIFPLPLQRFVGRAAQDVPWRFKLPGIKEYKIAETEAGEAVLYWVKAGRRLPSHTHEGDEVTLLLKGGFTDPLGHYRRGDIAIADAEVDHTPVADMDEDCLCFAVTDAPLQLTGPVMRLLRKVFHH